MATETFKTLREVALAIDTVKCSIDGMKGQLALMNLVFAGYAATSIGAFSYFYIDSKSTTAALLRIEILHQAGFDGIDKRFDGNDERFDAVAKRFDGVDKRFDAVAKRFDGVDKRLDGVDKRFDGLDKRLDGMDKRMDAIDKRIDGIDKRMDSMDNKLGQILGLLQPKRQGLLGGDARADPAGTH